MGAGVMDFSSEPVPPIKFTVDGDEFWAAGEAPGGTVTDLVVASDSDADGDQLRLAMEFFDQVLLPESAELFAERLRSPENPISLQKAMKIFSWLVKEYTDFPTQEPSPSAPGSRGTARSSAARSSGKAATTRSPKKAVRSAAP